MRLVLLALALTSLLTGCQTPSGVECSTRTFGSTAGYQNKSFYIVMPRSGNALENQQYAMYAQNALANRGLTPAKSVDKADWEISMNYGISAPRQEIQSRVIPVIGQTGYSSIYPSAGVVTPAYGIIGATTAVRSDSLYDRSLTLTAKKIGTSQIDWSIDVASTGNTGDLNMILPYMLVAASEALKNPSGTSDSFNVLQSAIEKRGILNSH